MIIRTKVQDGKRVIYRPGWDCHGLPIEMKALGSDGTKGLPPVKIRESARKLATKTVKDQMKAFRSYGVMSEWDNPWTTMDKDYEIRQLRVFQKLVRRGLIYRKRKPVYWSTSTRTALAEAELEYKEGHESTAAFVRYRIASDYSSNPSLHHVQGPLYVAIWTTTPWTLPANKAIAVHKDMLYSVLNVDGYNLIVASSRLEAMLEVLPSAHVVVGDILGSSLEGLEYINRLQNVKQPIVTADFVTDDSGTGLVHMAPGHGQEDYEACSKLGIDAFAPITDDGHFTIEAYPADPERLSQGPTIHEGGGQAVMDIIADDVLKTHTIRHKYPYDWRTKKPVVIRATAQWFADVGSIKGDALKALEAVQFIPDTGRTRLENFVRGRSEWCISRQRSWGVPIPALYNENGEAVMTDESIEHIISVLQQRSSQAWFSDAPDDPAWIPSSLRGNFRRGTDTMDVWFDSGSSWTEVDQPADVYLEGSDQHRGWFQSSLLTYIATKMADGAATITAPFKTLITHGFTLDDQGKKMSKSLGNTISPEQVMDGTLLPPVKPKKGEPRPDALGPDALRLWAASVDYTSDIPIGPSVLAPVHTALIKYRTILKMIVGSMHESARTAPLTKLDLIALMHLNDTMKQVREAFRKNEFHQGTQIINRWIANELSSFYLDALKDRLYCGDGGGVLEPIFVGFLRMLAPVTPLLVEEAWAHRPQWMVDDIACENPARHIYDDAVIDQSRSGYDQEALREEWSLISTLRDAVKVGLETARDAKQVGSSLQCSVVIEVEADRALECLKRFQEDLDVFFVVSSAEVNAPLPQNPEWSYVREFTWQGAQGKVHILPPKEAKCSRCWRYLAHEEDDLCQRCDDVVTAGPESSS